MKMILSINLLKDKTFYIAPTINPDARDYFTLNRQSLQDQVLMPCDNDRDGLFDEDGTDDLNGDKNISQMRRKNPNGNYKSDPNDPRKMIRVEPEKKVNMRLLGS